MFETEANEGIFDWKREGCVNPFSYRGDLVVSCYGPNCRAEMSANSNAAIAEYSHGIFRCMAPFYLIMLATAKQNFADWGEEWGQLGLALFFRTVWQG